MTDELQNLLSRYADDLTSEPAFRALAQHVSGLIYHCAFRQTNSTTLAEEALQNVLLKLSRNAKRLSNHPTPLAWIDKTTTHEGKHLIRREARHHRKLEALKDQPNMTNSPEPNLQTRELLEQSLAHLTTKEREIVLARHYEGRSFREIARTFSISEDASRMRVKRAMAKLAAFLTLHGLTYGESKVEQLLTEQLTRSCPAQILQKIKLPPANSGSTLTALLTSSSMVKPVALVSTCALAVWSGYHFTNLQTKIPGESLSKVTAESGLSYPGQPIRALRSSTSRPPLTIEQVIAGSPVAYQQLDLLYQSHPSLKPTKVFAEDQTNTIVYHLRNLPETQTLPELEKADYDKITNLVTTNDWNTDDAQKLVRKYQDYLDIIETCRAKQVGFSYQDQNYSTESTEVLLLKGLSKVTKLAMELAVQENNPQKAFRYRETLLRIAEDLNGGTLVQTITARAIVEGVQRQDLRWSKKGIANFAPTSDFIDWSEAFQEAVRLEFRGHISVAQAIRQANKEGRINHFTPTRNFENLSLDELRQENANNPFLEGQIMVSEVTNDHFFAHLAAAFQELLPTLLETENDPGLAFKDPVRARREFQEFCSNHFRDVSVFRLFIEQIAQTTIEAAAQTQLTHARYQTVLALHQAKADGLQVQAIGDLVPTYLDHVPTNPFDQKLFELNAEKTGLEPASTESVKR